MELDKSEIEELKRCIEAIEADCAMFSRIRVKCQQMRAILNIK